MTQRLGIPLLYSPSFLKVSEYIGQLMFGHQRLTAVVKDTYNSYL